MANWLLNGRLWLLARQRKRGCNGLSEDAEYLRRARAAFSANWQAVFSACEELADLARETPLQAARLYMTRVLDQERDSAWWRENAPYLAQPWFIWQYGRAQEVLTAVPAPSLAARPYFAVRPEGARRDAWARLRLIRDTACPDQGWLEISGPDEEEFCQQMRDRNMRPKDGNFIRHIGETAGPLMDRAVENGVLLLEAGYSLCVDEPEVQSRILGRQYAPEQKLWVLAPPHRDQLRLAYPKDQRLHRYVCLAGAVWNGRYMEISIRHTARVEELMGLYGFRASRAARMRMDAWMNAVNQATVYRARKQQKDTLPKPEDLFKQLLDKKIQVIEDLREADE